MDDEPTALRQVEDYAALVRGLLHDLAVTSITSIDLRQGDLRVAIKRVPGAMGQTLRVEPTDDESDARPIHWRPVGAPLTGLFYNRPAPNDEPYVVVGSQVESDHVIGLIESMKMFNEVLAETAGIVREVVSENGALIEAGQTILYIEPVEDEELPLA